MDLAEALHVAPGQLLLEEARLLLYAACCGAMRVPCAQSVVRRPRPSDEARVRFPEKEIKKEEVCPRSCPSRLTLALTLLPWLLCAGAGGCGYGYGCGCCVCS